VCPFDRPTVARPSVGPTVQSTVRLSYERPFQPEKAANLRGLLFEPADGITKYELSDGIRSVLEDYEPRIKVQHIQVIDEEVNNSYRISIYFEIIQLDIMSEVEIVLQRLR
jgi:phage baseplate assembly protein W